MQNFEMKDIILKIKKTKTEVKRELEEAGAKGRRNENADMQDKVNECITNEDAVNELKRIWTNNSK